MIDKWKSVFDLYKDGLKINFKYSDKYTFEVKTEIDDYDEEDYIGVEWNEFDFYFKEDGLFLKKNFELKFRPDLLFFKEDVLYFKDIIIPNTLKEYYGAFLHSEENGYYVDGGGDGYEFLNNRINKKIIQEINECILSDKFKVEAEILTKPLTFLSRELLDVLLSKLSHIECDMYIGDLEIYYTDLQGVINKLTRKSDFNKIFYILTNGWFSRNIEFYNWRDYGEEYIFCLNNEDKRNFAMVINMFPKLENKQLELFLFYTILLSMDNYSNEKLSLILSNTLVEDLKYNQYLVKCLCPVLLTVGDIEGFLRLFKLVEYDSNDTDFIFPVVNWCISNGRDDLIKEPLDMLKKLQPYHPKILEAEIFLERQQLIKKSGISLDDINILSGVDFESLVVEYLKYYTHIKKIECTPVSKDFGADILLLTEDETKIAIQCKRFSKKVNLKAVQEITAALKHYNADIGIVISNNGFLPSAIQLAESNNIELWGSDELLKLIAHESNFSILFEC